MTDFNSATYDSESHIDVLVVGAGPAGLFCANGLAKAGVNVRIVDKRDVKVPAGQADGIQPRTIEVLQSYGLAERLLAEANHMHLAAFYNPGPDGNVQLTERLPDITAPSARYPFECTLHQGAIESIFLDSMESVGLTVDRPIEPTSIVVSEDEAELADISAYPIHASHSITPLVTLKHLKTSAKELVHAKFLVGTDGAHSFIRRALGFEMLGSQTPFVWGVVDLVPDTDFPDTRSKTVIHSNSGAVLIIPREGDKVRLYIQLENRKEDQVVEGVKLNLAEGEEGVNPEKLLKIASKVLTPYTLKPVGDIEWWTVYSIGQRVASRFSLAERAFIAGDACHTHSPKAGQGMNASMNDTHNLIWKLALVLRGIADISLLKTYEAERKKYAQDLIDFDKSWAHLFSGKPQSELYEEGFTPEQLISVFQTFGEFTSGIGIHYADSIIVNSAHQPLSANLTIGKRFPPQVFVRYADAKPIEVQDLLISNTRFKLFFFVGDVTDKQQLERIEGLGESLKYLREKPLKDICEVFTVCTGNNFVKAPITTLPEVLRPHWTKVLLDDKDLSGRQGGQGYKNFGISPTGAGILVRPDGYIAMLTSLEFAGGEIWKYFAKFCRALDFSRN